MARSREFKMMMKAIYWFCILAIIAFIGYIAFEVFLTVNDGVN